MWTSQWTDSFQTQQPLSTSRWVGDNLVTEACDQWASPRDGCHDDVTQVAQRLAAPGPGHALHGGGAGPGDPMGGLGPEYYDMLGSNYYDAYDELGYQVHV